MRHEIIKSDLFSFDFFATSCHIHSVELIHKNSLACMGLFVFLEFFQQLVNLTVTVKRKCCYSQESTMVDFQGFASVKCKCRFSQKKEQ